MEKASAEENQKPCMVLIASKTQESLSLTIGYQAQIRICAMVASERDT